MNSSSLSINELENPIKGIYERFRQLRDEITRNGKVEPYIGHQYQYMVKAFSLFVDYYNQYLYSLPLALRKLDEDLNDLPDDVEK